MRLRQVKAKRMFDAATRGAKAGVDRDYLDADEYSRPEGPRLACL